MALRDKPKRPTNSNPSPVSRMRARCWSQKVGVTLGSSTQCRLAVWKWKVKFSGGVLFCLTNCVCAAHLL